VVLNPPSKPVSARIHKELIIKIIVPINDSECPFFAEFQR
jgi:hypothetical protein